MFKILMHTRPCIHNTAGAFSCNFPYSLAALQNFLTLFFSSIPIVIDLWELKIKSKYAKQYLFRKNNGNVVLSSDGVSFWVHFHTLCELWLEINKVILMTSSEALRRRVQFPRTVKIIFLSVNMSQKSCSIEDYGLNRIIFGNSQFSARKLK